MTVGSSSVTQIEILKSTSEEVFTSDRTTSTSKAPTNNADFVDYLLESTNYDKRERPDQNANRSVEVL